MRQETQPLLWRVHRTRLELTVWWRAKVICRSSCESQNLTGAVAARLDKESSSGAA